jgi:hypothetical protein
MLRYETDYSDLIPSSYDECTIRICAPIWDEIKDLSPCENEYLEFIPSSYDKYRVCKLFYYSRSAVYYEINLFEVVLSLYRKIKAHYRSEERAKNYNFRNKMPLKQRYHHFYSCSIFLIISECINLEYSFHRSFMKKHDFAVFWLEYYLKHISASIVFSHCVLIRKRDGGKIGKVKKEEERPIIPNGYIEERQSFKSYFSAGGRHQTMVKGEIVYEYLQTCSDVELLNNNQYFEGKHFDFKGYENINVTSSNVLKSDIPLFFSKIPLEQLSSYLNAQELRHMAVLHNIPMPYKAEKKNMATYFCDHHCTQCDLYVSVLTERENKKSKYERAKKKDENYSLPSKFPPDPPSKTLLESIIKGFCSETAPQNFVEGGCAVCGKLSPMNSMALLNEIECDLNVISPGNVGRLERIHESDPVMSLKGPILAEGCDHCCVTCRTFLKKGKMPPESLANSFWIGSIPSVLKNLTFAEKMLISKIRHNKCLVRVSSGRAKMTANVIMFANPTVKVYHALPPSRREISEVLAFVFQGPIQPTESDIKRTPMLVRRNVVRDALDWLKLNHTDYEDLYISLDNLGEYPLAGVPVNIEYSKSDPESGNKFASAMSNHDNEIEDGTTEGPCPFTVHGLTGPEFENMSMERLKAKALQHLAQRGATLGISHDSKPQSMYDNPQAYPQMFPWLFPYGFGGIGQKCHFAKISETTHKRNLLMYHDKRFQTDFYFPMIAFNHEQLKAGVTGSFLLANRKKWPDISNRLKSLNHNVLKSISDKLSSGSHFTPETVEEKKCFRLLNDLDHVGGFVKGSITSKKHMRNEIWSMISQLGSPSWFITLSPADNRHPICLYYADKDIEYKPELRSANERNILVAQNPVAAARFFDLMIRIFIKHVLGIGTEHSGLYGNTAGYYGTVEQQGRLTLHLHTILWIKNALSPQEIRDRLMNNGSQFQEKLIKYLEGCQKGEFITGTMEYVKSKVPMTLESHSKGIHTIFRNDSLQMPEKTYQDPTQTLPEEPPTSYESNDSIKRHISQSLSQWWLKFNDTVDDILLRSNIHKCSNSDPENSKFKPKGCLNKDGICKARFPRPIVPETTVNYEDGYINVKKTESMLNTISPCITYLFRCNTDVTSLLSGTSIKAVISYVTDYVAKPTLKTYQIFATAYNVFERNSNLDADDSSRTNDARKLMLKIVNALSSKMEIGSPMASMYLLQNPDHYTSHKFIPFWWKSFVNEVSKSENCDHNINEDHDIDIKLEDICQEKGTTRHFNHVVDDFETIGKNVSDLRIDVSHSDDMFMDIDCPKTSISQGVIEADKVKLHDDIEEDHDSKPEYQTQKGDRFDEEGEEIEERDDDDKEEGEDDDDDDGDFEDDSIDEKLLISQDGEDYVASSKVDDYKYRPEAHNFLSLYEWTRTSVKTRASGKANDKTYLPFLVGHGQLNTHVVKLVPSRSETFILNFIGGPLPRRDQGDFEYYCRTMLTLFKPWRSCRDLKDESQSWAEVFTTYEFNAEDKRIMDNFNLRYECLDERDDYHAILKRQTKVKVRNNSSLFPDHYDNDCNLGISSNFEEDYGDPQMLGPNAIKKAQQMIETVAMIKNACCTDENENTKLQLNIHEFHPAIPKTGAEWKNLVKQYRQKLLNNKKINYSVNIDASPKSKSNFVEPLSVNLLSAEYFMHNFQAKEAKAREIITKTILDFSLNKEQKRAFHIIANHASEVCPSQLKMHLGGMGGTGKSQVIKALISMFDQRKENHRFIVLAPTGTAAALLNGSTYHSILGIRLSNDYSEEEESLRNENSVIKEIQGRLEGVDYIFIDEISMIACHELYAISSQLSRATNEHNKPFGGKNIILAGDFAQLPPTSGSPLYSSTVSKAQNNHMSKRDQESTIGKILWHQITTVVILTQNMRQTEMSEADQKFRTALSNMRYAACTADDLEFLKTLHVDKNEREKTLSNPEFRNVSVITSLNTQKDQINETCSLRFAQDTGQKLTHFYSIDKLGNSGLGRKRRGTKVSKKVSAGSDIPSDVKQTLWDSSPHSSEHFPGKLSLCLGMPIMIRNNDATELCITKGQEAFVVGWDSIDGPDGRKVLETLYLELINPPRIIELPHLPRNVIPMTRASKKIKCSLPNDYEINIIRQQINVLPNFSMTDFASQGKTRLKNPVNLSHCRNFQSIYTCLSRSSSAAGTLIIRGFNSSKVTKGLPGHLRQEFRELHLLNDITREIYEGRLDKKYFAPLRNPMIYKYQTEIKNKKSNDLHSALKLSEKEFIFKEKSEDGTWNMDVYQNLTVSSKTNKKLKRKLPESIVIDVDTDLKIRSKKTKTCSFFSENCNARSPVGLIWDQNDYSCAYDSLFTVLYHIWAEGQLKHRAYFEERTHYIQILCTHFNSFLNKKCTFESVRDQLRMILNRAKPLEYRYGTNYTDISLLVTDFTSAKFHAMSHLRCLTCNFSAEKQLRFFQDYTLVGWSSVDHRILQTASIQSYLNYKMKGKDVITNKLCPSCAKSLYDTQYIKELPSILIFSLASWININGRLTFDVSNISKEYVLKGVIYSNRNHFTARLIDDMLNVWYHDGQTTRSLCQQEQSLVGIDGIVPLKSFGEYKAIIAFYVER